MVTIKDVAKKAGVSLSTASYAMNDDRRISDKTKAHVLRIAEELGYLPSGTARNLKKQQSHTIVACMTEFGGPVHTKLLVGIQKELLAQGYSLLVASGKSAAKMLLERNADGAIVNDSSLANDLIMRVANPNFPVIVLNRHLQSEHIIEMNIENQLPTYEMTKHLINRGYHDIAYLSGVEQSYDNLYRFKGFVKAMSEAQLSAEHYYKGNFTMESGSQLIHSLIREKKPVHRAFFCANDEMAIGVIKTLKYYGYHVPNDVAVAGFDDIELSEYIQPTLSTVHVNREGFGTLVARNIVALCQTKAPFEKKTKVSTELIIRQST